MKKLLFSVNVTLSYATTAKDAVDFIEEINDELIRRGYGESVSVTRSASKSATGQGPLEKKWCEIKSVRGVRRTEGRTAEEQAEYNLRTYADYNDEQITELKASAPEIPSENISEQSGVVLENADNDEEIVDDNDLL